MTNLATKGENSVAETPHKATVSSADNIVPQKTPSQTIKQRVRKMQRIESGESEDVALKPQNGKGAFKTLKERKTPGFRLSSPAPTKKKVSRKTKKIDDGTNHKVTDYFPVRRSTRKPVLEQKKDENALIEEALNMEDEPGIKIVTTELKGRGIHSTRAFTTGEYIVEYRGDLIDPKEAERREAIYENDPTKGCYMYHFAAGNKTYVIDATAESAYKGRLLNHSYRRPNVRTRVFVDSRGTPHLILVAKRPIEEDTELLYDYGDKDKKVVENNPWLRNS